MATEIKTEIRAVREIKSGELVEEKDFETHTVITVTCDNPKCGNVITWVQEDVGKNEDSLPEEFFRLLRVTRSYNNEGGNQSSLYDFCCAFCGSKYLVSAYVPSVSPKEWAKRHPVPPVSTEGAPSASKGPKPIPPPVLEESSCPGESEGPHEPGLLPPPEEIP